MGMREVPGVADVTVNGTPVARVVLVMRASGGMIVIPAGEAALTRISGRLTGGSFCTVVATKSAVEPALNVSELGFRIGLTVPCAAAEGVPIAQLARNAKTAKADRGWMRTMSTPSRYSATAAEPAADTELFL